MGETRNRNDQRDQDDRAGQSFIVSFGDWVRQRRRALDLTQAALARRVGCAVVTIKMIEQDQRRPSRQMAQLLADHLGVSPAMREDFIRMARGQFVPAIPSPQATIRPPAFLQRDDLPASSQPPRFVARERELAWLQTHLQAALSGNGRVAFILGDAGCGKTSLLAAFAHQAQAAHPGLIVASGHCNARAGIGDPYLPFRDILGMLSGDLEPRWATGDLSRAQVLRLWSLFPYTVQALLERGPNLVDSLIPGRPLLRRINAAVPDRVDWLSEVQTLIERQRSQPLGLELSHLLEEVTQTLRALAARHPLLILLDDLQWVDDASSSLLFHLGRRLAGTRMLLLGAYRPVEFSLGQEVSGQNPLAPIVTEFRRTYGDIQLDLNQQPLPERRAFIDALLDSEPNRLDQTFRESLFLHTQGHPLFAVEMLRNMQANGTLIRDETGKWIENRAAFLQELPLRVEAVIEQRISRLDPDLRRMLTIASVEGETFTAQVVAGVLGLDERLVLRRLGQDLEQGHHLVREHGAVTVSQQPLNQYRFRHVLFQEYVYDRLSQGERRLYHRQVGKALETIFEDETRGVISALLDPGEDVSETLDRRYPEPLVQFGPALVNHFLVGQDWAKAAAYALCVGAGAMKVYALREAIAADNTDCICYGFDCVGYGNLELQRIDAAASAFTNAIQRSKTSGAIIPQLLGQAGLAMAQFSAGRMEASADLRAVLTALQTYDDQAGAAEVAHMLGTCLIHTGDLDRAEEYLDMALAFYRSTEMRPYLARTLFTLAELFTRQDRPTHARDAQAEAETLMAALAS